MNGVARLRILAAALAIGSIIYGPVRGTPMLAVLGAVTLAVIVVSFVRDRRRQKKEQG